MLGLLLVTIIWGAGFTASDIALQSLEPFQIMAGRFLLAALLMGAVSYTHLDVYKRQAYQLGIQAETVTEMPAIGFSTASTTLAARALGQKDYELKETYFNQLIRIALRISICTSLLLIVLPKAFMGLMTNNPKLQAIGAVYVLSLIHI